MAILTSSAEPTEQGESLRGLKLIAGYALVVGILAVAVAISISLGHHRHAAPAVGGFYSSSSACLGNDFKLVQSGEFVDAAGGPSGKLRLRGNHLTGTVHCIGGSAAALDLTRSEERRVGKECRSRWSPYH